MKKSKWLLPRRTFLKGMGASLALPFLEAMGDEVIALWEKTKSLCRKIEIKQGVYLPELSYTQE